MTTQRRLAPLGAAVLPFAVWAVTGIAGGQPVPFHIETRLVVLRVLVTNGRGEVVVDLDRKAFSVYEDGRRQSIAIFRRDDVPISLGVVIDNSRSMRTLRARVEAAALAFVRASNPLDEAFVVNFADTPRVDVPFTNDIHALEAGIARVDAIGGTALRDAIIVADRYLQDHATRERRGLLIITDGNDNASAVSASHLRTLVERTGAVIYAIRLAHDRPGPDERKGDDDLEHLTRASGGVVLHTLTTSDVDRAVLDVARQMRSEYTIAYAPTNQALDGSYRAVRVAVTASGGLKVRTRRGYWATGLSAVPARR